MCEHPGYLVSTTRAVYCGNIRAQRDAPAAAFVRRRNSSFDSFGRRWCHFASRTHLPRPTRAHTQPLLWASAPFVSEILFLWRKLPQIKFFLAFQPEWEQMTKIIFVVITSKWILFLYKMLKSLSWKLVELEKVTKGLRHHCYFCSPSLWAQV